MSDSPTRPAWLWFPILLYGLVGTVCLYNLGRLTLAEAAIGLPEYLFVGLWAVIPLLIASGLLKGRRWAWWLGLAAPLLYIGAFVLEMVFLFLNAGGDGLVGIAGGLLSLLPFLALAVACICLLVPSVRQHFAASGSQAGIR
jgi:hypothetical protein